MELSPVAETALTLLLYQRHAMLNVRHSRPEQQTRKESFVAEKPSRYAVMAKSTWLNPQNFSV